MTCGCEHSLELLLCLSSVLIMVLLRSCIVKSRFSVGLSDAYAYAVPVLVPLFFFFFFF